MIFRNQNRKFVFGVAHVDQSICTCSISAASSDFDPAMHFLIIFNITVNAAINAKPEFRIRINDGAPQRAYPFIQQVAGFQINTVSLPVAYQATGGALKWELLCRNVDALPIPFNVENCSIRIVEDEIAAMNDQLTRGGI